MITVFVKSYNEPEFNIKEIFRYMGCGIEGEEFLPLINECIEECRDKLTYKVCWCETSVVHTQKGVDFGFLQTDSKDLKKNLEGCHSAIVFGATIGLEIDRLISKYGRLKPSKALIFQAVGAERIESLCNAFNNEIKSDKQNNFTHPRFSPGYGDLPLECQKDIFGLLDCPKKIGLSLNDSLLMSPSKSVTAFIGVSDKCGEYEEKTCDKCNKKDCRYRS